MDTIIRKEDDMNHYSGLDYIKIDIANQYGIAGKTFKQRIAWVESKKKNLGNYMNRAKNPFRYAAAVMALDEVMAGKSTGYLVGLDASASGIQLMSALTGCVKGAANTGLAGKRPKDVYSIITDVMNNLLNSSTTYERNDVKGATMTSFYGSKRQPKLAFGEDTPELKAFYQARELVAPGAAMLMKEMQAAWQPYALEHSWTMPDGFKVKKKVKAMIDTKIEIDELPGHPCFTYRHVENVGLEEGRSLEADIIQSCDGYVVREMSRRCKFDMQFIHDEYMAHPNNMNQVRQTYIDILAELADGTLINSILSEITNTDIRIKPITKKLGDQIRRSEYAIH